MRVVMLFQGENPHPAHRAFGEAFDSEYIHFETRGRPGKTVAYTGRVYDRIRTGLSVTDADLLLAEGTSPLQTGIIASIRSDAPLIYICADQTFRTLHQRKTESIWKLMPNVIDGVIAVSHVAWQWAKPYVEAPFEVVRPPIMNDKYERLRAVTPSSPDDGPIVTIGEARATKNFEILPEIADQTNRETIVLGAGHEEKPYTNHPNVTAPGWVSVDEFAKTLKRSALYVQPSEADACPVATMEAMLSGTPVYVSEMTGTKEIGAFSAPLDNFTTSIKRYLEIPSEERVTNGEMNRKQVEEFTIQRQKTRFRKAVRQWI